MGAGQSDRLLAFSNEGPHAEAQGPRVSQAPGPAQMSHEGLSGILYEELGLLCWPNTLHIQASSHIMLECCRANRAVYRVCIGQEEAQRQVNCGLQLRERRATLEEIYPGQVWGMKQMN